MTAQKPPSFMDLQKHSAERRIELPPALELMALHKSGLTYAQIGQRFGCSAALVGERIGQSGFNKQPVTRLPLTPKEREREQLLSREWIKDAACRGQEEPFFPDGKGSRVIPSVRAAQRLCAVCPVRATCLAYALVLDERHGVWGGLTFKQRRAIKNQQPVECRAPGCANVIEPPRHHNQHFCSTECVRETNRLRNNASARRSAARRKAS